MQVFKSLDQVGNGIYLFDRKDRNRKIFSTTKFHSVLFWNNRVRQSKWFLEWHLTSITMPNIKMSRKKSNCIHLTSWHYFSTIVCIYSIVYCHHPCFYFPFVFDFSFSNIIMQESEDCKISDPLFSQYICRPYLIKHIKQSIFLDESINYSVNILCWLKTWL